MKAQFIVLGFLMGVVSVFAQGSPPAITQADQGTNTAPNSKTQGQDNKNNSNNFSLITIQVNGQAPQKNTNDKGAQSTENGEHGLTLVQTIADGIIALFTIVLAGVGIAQVCVYRRQRDIMAKQTSISEKQTEILVNQHKDSRRTSRANISIEAKALPDKNDSIIYPDVSNAQRFNLTIVMKNTGPTPATNVVVVGGEIGIFDHGLNHWYGIEALKRREINSVATLSPGQERFLNVTAEREFSVGELDYIDGYMWPYKRIYAYGRVEYKDVFGKDRWTNFCFVFWPNGPRRYVPLIAEKGNETDHPEEWDDKPEPTPRVVPPTA